MNQVTIRTFLVICSALLMGFGCTRPNVSSNISMALPVTHLKSQSLPAGLQLGYVAINVHGEGLSQIVCTLDISSKGKKKSSGPCNFSNYPMVELEMDAGPKRLIQVLLVFEDENNDGGPSRFEYGDKQLDLVAGENRISIDVAEVQMVDQASGDLQGRFLTSKSQGPSGIFEARLSVRNDRPSITVLRKDIFSGWFTGFSLGKTKFEYYINGQNLFNNRMNLETFQALAATGKPIYIKNHDDNDYVVSGFFGASENLSGKSAADACDETSRYHTCVDGESKFIGPFKPVTTAGLYVNHNQTAAVGTLAWSYLPGVVSGKAIDGVEIFLLENLSTSQLDALILQEGEFNCQGLINTTGVRSLARLPLSAQASQFSHSDLRDLKEGKAAVICPYRGTTSFATAIAYPDFLADHRKGSDNWFDIKMETGHKRTGVESGSCTRINGRFVDHNGSLKALPEAATLDLSLFSQEYSEPGFLYTDSTCTTALSPSISIAAGQSEFSFYYGSYYDSAGSTPIGPGWLSIEAQLSLTNGDYRYGRLGLGILSDSTPPDRVMLTFNNRHYGAGGDYILAENICYEIEIRTDRIYMYPAVFPEDMLIGITNSSPYEFKFYDDHECKKQTAGVTDRLIAGDPIVKRYASFNFDGSDDSFNGEITFEVKTTAGVSTLSDFPMVILGLNTFDSWALRADGSLSSGYMAGNCYHIEVAPINLDGALVNYSGSAKVEIRNQQNGDSLMLSTEYGCNNATASPVTVTSEGYPHSQSVFLKVPDTGMPDFAEIVVSWDNVGNTGSNYIPVMAYPSP